MFLRRVRVTQIRGVTALDVKIPRGRRNGAGWIVLAGRNGTGKTTVLQAIALAVLGHNHMLRLLPGPGNFIHRDREAGRTDVWMEGAADDGTEEGQRAFRLGVTWGRDDRIPHPPRGEPPNREREFWSPQGVRGRGWCFLAYGTGRFAAANVSSGEDEGRHRGRRSGVATLFDRGIMLTAAHDWVCEAVSAGPPLFGPDRSKLPLEVLKLLLADGLSAEATSGVEVELRRDGIYIGRPEGLIPVSQLGQGLESVALLVTDMVRQMAAFFGERFMGGENWRPPEDGAISVPHSGVVLIDEIENHLHPQLQQRIGFWLKDHFPKVQFIVTTHSPFVCQAADEKCLFRVTDSGSVEAVGDAVFRDVVNGSVDDAVITDLFDLPSPYSEESVKRRRDLADLEGRILAGETLPPAAALERDRLLSTLPDDSSNDIEGVLAALRSRP